MSDKVFVDVDDVVRDSAEAIRKVLLNHERSGSKIDTDDPDAVGELIRDQGWTLYDLSIDLDDVADMDNIVSACDIDAFVRERDDDDIMESMVSYHGTTEVLDLIDKHGSEEHIEKWVKANAEEKGWISPELSSKDLIDRVVKDVGPYRALEGFSLQCIKDYLTDMHGLGMDEIPEPEPKTKVIGNLEWSVVVYENKTWEEAQNLAAANAAEGWRLPTVHELVGLWDYGTQSCPHFDSRVTLWAAQQYDNYRAWCVGFATGLLSDADKSESYAVRLVRDVKKAE